VGVVRDLRYRDVKAPPPAIYVPLRQSPFPPRFLILRAGVDHLPVLALTQRALQEIDATEPVTEAATIDDLLKTQLAGPKFHMFALVLFAIVAVLLAGVGVFGVLAAFVTQRSREVGLRVALGANRGQVGRLVLSKVGWPVGLGLIVGTSLALATTPFLGPLLFRVSAYDLSSFAAGWIVLLTSQRLPRSFRSAEPHGLTPSFCCDLSSQRAPLQVSQLTAGRFEARPGSEAVP
jgi:putative ABC transport system permease protein